MGGKFLPKLNTCGRPIANKYREGKMKRTLKRESKVLEIAGIEGMATSVECVVLVLLCGRVRVPRAQFVPLREFASWGGALVVRVLPVRRQSGWIRPGRQWPCGRWLSGQLGRAYSRGQMAPGGSRCGNRHTMGGAGDADGRLAARHCARRRCWRLQGACVRHQCSVGDPDEMVAIHPS